MSPEVNSQIAVFRQKAAEGTITLEDYKAAVRLMREDRKSAARSSDSAKRGKAKAAIPSQDDMLDELENL